MKKTVILVTIIIIFTILFLITYRYFTIPVKKNSAQIPPEVNTEEQILADLKSSLDCPDIDSCRVDNISGNYAKGLMNQAYWIALKSDGKWKLAVSGNGIPACDEVDKYSIPVEIYGNCINTEGYLRNK